MPRPSSHADQRLIATAREMLPLQGCSGLNLRDVATKARVNLGMFHYHFRNKREFVRKVLDEIYEGFLRELESIPVTGTKPKERLRSALLVLARFSRDNRVLITSLVSDALRGDEDVIDFIGANVPRHLRIFLALIREGQVAGEIIAITPRQVFVFLATAINCPNFFTAALERSGRRPASFIRTMKTEFLTDSALQQRIDMATKGVSA